MSRTQRSIVLPAPGVDLVLQDRAIPIPGPGQVLVKITAAALNPVDNMHRHYPVLISGYPAVLGCDVAGTVEALGDGTSTFQKGDRVFFQGDFSHDGATFQHYALVNSQLVAKTPSNISDEQSCTLPTSLVTAVVALFHGTAFNPPLNGPTASNNPVLILGGSGSIGRACVQLARIAGFSPIITTSSKAHAESLEAIGATHVFERTVSPATIHEVLATNGKPLELAIDTVSNAETQLFAFQALTAYPNASRNAQLQFVLPPADELQAQNNALAEGAIKSGIVAGVAHKTPEVFAPFFEVAGKWLEEGRLVPAQVQLLSGGLAGAQAGLDTLAKGVSGVKLVVNP